jgi:hypothetical protein
VGEAGEVAVPPALVTAEGVAAARDGELTVGADAVGEGDADAVGAADGAMLGTRPPRVTPSSVAGGADRDADGWTTMGGSSSPSAVGATQAATAATPAMTAITAKATITSVPIGERVEPPG